MNHVTDIFSASNVTTEKRFNKQRKLGCLTILQGKFSVLTQKQYQTNSLASINTANRIICISNKTGWKVKLDKLKIQR